ncbi:MAG: hypothetical protein JW772_00830 [Candidatus Diapherotrites archaeon]|nr:hypothetical protein [Candidatus Diapherotrites archaeon]
MNAPKELWIALIFAVMLISAGFFIGQTNNIIGQAQGTKITGTIVLMDQTQGATHSGALHAFSLPGTKCDVIATGCGGRFSLWDTESEVLIPNEFHDNGSTEERIDLDSSSEARNQTIGYIYNNLLNQHVGETEADMLQKLRNDGCPNLLFVRDLTDNAKLYECSAGSGNYIIVQHQPLSTDHKWNAYGVTGGGYDITNGPCSAFKATGLPSKNYLVMNTDVRDSAIPTIQNLYYIQVAYSCS